MHIRSGAQSRRAAETPQLGRRSSGRSSTEAGAPAPRPGIQGSPLMIGHEGAGIGVPGCRGLGDPEARSLLVARHAEAEVIAAAEVVLTAAVVELSGALEAAEGAHVVLLHTLTVAVAETEIVEGVGVVLRGSFFVPQGGLLLIARDALPGNVTGTEVVLSIAVALLGGLAVPLGSLRHVLRDAVAEVVAAGQQELAGGIAVFCGLAQQRQGLGILLGVVVHKGISGHLLGGGAAEEQGSCQER